MVLIMDLLDLRLVLGPENIDISVQRVAVLLGAYYLKYTRSLAAHVMQTGKKIEIMKSRYTQHRPSSFSTRLSSPW